MERCEQLAARWENILETSEAPPPIPGQGVALGYEEADLDTLPDDKLFEILVWRDRLLHHEDKPPAPNDKRIGYWVGRWIDHQQARTRGGEITAGRYSAYRYSLLHFADFAGADNDISTITADLVERYHEHLLCLVGQRKNEGGKSGCSPNYAKARLDALRMFAEWLDGRDLLPFPKNLRNRKSLTIKLPTTTPTFYPIADIQTLLADERTPDRMRLYVLLMLNMGMYQGDISDLTKEQVDLTSRRITRRRSKTEDNPDTPIVSYRLWERTAALLAKFLDKDNGNPLALLHERGMALQRKWIDSDGKLQHICYITAAYNPVKQRLGLRHSLGKLRKTSSNLIFNNPKYRHLSTLFLGHSPRSVAERFYVENAAETLDEAIAWLATQYGVK
jgi:integrase